MNQSSFIDVSVLAKVDRDSAAYQSGKAVGTVVGYVLPIIIVIWVAKKLFSKK